MTLYLNMKRGVKKNVKAFIRSIKKQDVDKIKKIMESYDIISFDVFDTLICRNVPEPSDIFYMIGDRFNAESGCSSTDFFVKRYKAEEHAKKKNKNREITLEDIYNQFEYISSEQKKELIALEKDIELRNCLALNNGKELFGYAQKLNKTIIIISDMYLPKKVIDSILCKNGYYGYLELFVSSEEQVNKKTGYLYKRVIERYKTKKILHIGDNPISDYFMAKKNGIDAVIV